MRRLLMICVAGLLLTANVVASQLNGTPGGPGLGDPIMPLDGTWIILAENMNTGDFFTGTYTWDSPVPVTFTITDLFVVTDAFNVYDSGNLVLSTPILPDYYALGIDPFLAPPWTYKPDEALANPLFSKGVITFDAGYHSIQIQDTHIPTAFPDGTVAFKATPEPTTICLLGLGGLGLLRKRRI